MTDMHVPTEITSSHIMFSLGGVAKCVSKPPHVSMPIHGAQMIVKTTVPPPVPALHSFEPGSGSMYVSEHKPTPFQEKLSLTNQTKHPWNKN